MKIVVMGEPQGIILTVVLVVMQQKWTLYIRSLCRFSYWKWNWRCNGKIWGNSLAYRNVCFNEMMLLVVNLLLMYMERCSGSKVSLHSSYKIKWSKQLLYGCMQPATTSKWITSKLLFSVIPYNNINYNYYLLIT